MRKAEIDPMEACGDGESDGTAKAGGEEKVSAELYRAQGMEGLYRLK